MSDDYEHPSSGRIYREGDPAHHFAQLAAALAQQCDEFQRHYDARLVGRDYLEQHTTWMSDPDRIARTVKHTIEALDKAYTAVVMDRDMHTYGLGKQDEEWHRKYGKVT